MIQIRHNVFETNSSSTHSITMCLKSEYTEWKKDKLYFVDCYSVENKFVTWEELIKLIKKPFSPIKMDVDDIEEIESNHNSGKDELVDDMLADYDVFTYSSWCDHKHPELERYSSTFTTPKGEEICAFGYYGEDY